MLEPIRFFRDLNSVKLDSYIHIYSNKPPQKIQIYRLILIILVLNDLIKLYKYWSPTRAGFSTPKTKKGHEGFLWWFIELLNFKKLGRLIWSWTATLFRERPSFRRNNMRTVVFVNSTTTNQQAQNYNQKFTFLCATQNIQFFSSVVL